MLGRRTVMEAKTFIGIFLMLQPSSCRSRLKVFQPSTDVLRHRGGSHRNASESRRSFSAPGFVRSGRTRGGFPERGFRPVF
jgi:hypothetical protein